MDLSRTNHLVSCSDLHARRQPARRRSARTDSAGQRRAASQFARGNLSWLVLSSLAIAAVATGSVRAGDWPQILGPRRNGHADEEQLAGEWRTVAPTRLWSIEVGQGYAGPAVRADRVVVFHRLGDEEVATCVSAMSGDQRWERRWPTSYVSRIDRDAGPRCVPVIHQDRVFLFGAAGRLHCVDLAKGRELWSRNLAKDYRARDGYFGAGSSPLVVGNLILVNVGGRSTEASIVALDWQSGETRWSALKDDASYSAPILRRSKGMTTALFITRMRLLELNPETGKRIFELPFGKQGPTVNAASPVTIDEDHLFVTASYGIGAQLLSLDSSPPKIVWESDDTLSSQYPTPVHDAGHLYGVHGREDGAPAELRCIEAKTGRTKWQRPQFGMAHLILADGKLLAQRTEGELLLLALTPDRYRELGRVALTENVIARAQPALSNGRYFVRDNGGRLSAWKLP